MPRGEAYKKSFNVIRTAVPDQSSIDYITTRSEICSYKLKVLAMYSADPDPANWDTDPLKNDHTSVYFGFGTIINAVTLKLFKCGVEVATLDNDDYGTFYDFNFHYDDYKKYIGYQIDWQKILNDTDLGEGEYFVRAECTTITSGTYEEDSFTYCLWSYTTNRADGTIRFEWYHSKIIGDRNIDTDLISFPNGTITGEPSDWYNSLRINGIVLAETTPTTVETDQYFNGKRNEITKEPEPTYEVFVKPMPYFIYKFMRNEIMLNDDLYLSDYNSRCPLKPFLNRNLQMPSIEPTWYHKIRRVSAVSNMTQKFNNLRKRHQ